MGHPEELLDEESQKEAVKVINHQNQNDRAYKTGSGGEMETILAAGDIR
jgi:hypothetical protein